MPMIGPIGLETAVPLKQSNYPKVKFWHRRNWTAFQNRVQDELRMVVRGRSRSSKGINVMMLYVESEDGVPVDGDMAKHIREKAKSFWYGLADNAPVRWGQATLQVKSDYCRQMVKWFPDLRLCSSDWKATNIATDFYTGWYKTRQKAGQEVEESSGNQNKRSCKDSMKIIPKRTWIQSDALVSS